MLADSQERAGWQARRRTCDYDSPVAIICVITCFITVHLCQSSQIVLHRLPSRPIYLLRRYALHVLICMTASMGKRTK